MGTKKCSNEPPRSDEHKNDAGELKRQLVRFYTGGHLGSTDRLLNDVICDDGSDGRNFVKEGILCRE